MIDLETLKFLQSAQENLFPAMEMKQGGMIDFAPKFKHIAKCFNNFTKKRTMDWRHITRPFFFQHYS